MTKILLTVMISTASSPGKLKDKERDLIVNTLPSKDQCVAEKNKRVRF